MPLDGKTRLLGNKFFQYSKVAVTAFHRLGTQPADKHVGVPGPGGDKSMFTCVVMHPRQISHILKRPYGTVDSGLADLFPLKKDDGPGNGEPLRVALKKPPDGFSLRRESQSHFIELPSQLFLGEYNFNIHS
jgi:hypothetical protein